MFLLILIPLTQINNKGDINAARMGPLDPVDKIITNNKIKLKVKTLYFL